MEESPVAVQYGDVEAAAKRIRGGVKETPLEVFNYISVIFFQPSITLLHYTCMQSHTQHSMQLSEMLGMNIYFKKEFLLPTGRYL